MSPAPRWRRFDEWDQRPLRHDRFAAEDPAAGFATFHSPFDPAPSARVENGRLILDEPTTLPEGTVIDFVVDDEGDDLTDEDRRALHSALLASWKSVDTGRLRPASILLDELRQRRCRCTQDQ